MACLRDLGGVAEGGKMLRYMAYVYAVVFIVLALAGYMGFMMKDGMLMGVFALNSWHNHVHLLSGVVAGIAGFMGSYWSKLYFQIFGVIYGLVAILGIFYGHEMIFGFLANSWGDVGLHAVLSAVALYLGFGCCSHCKEKM